MSSYTRFFDYWNLLSFLYLNLPQNYDLSPLMYRFNIFRGTHTPMHLNILNSIFFLNYLKKFMFIEIFHDSSSGLFALLFVAKAKY